MFTKITNFIFWIWDLVWLVKTKHSIQNLKKEFFQRIEHHRLCKIVSFITQGQCWSVCFLKNSPWWSLTWIDMIQIGLEIRLDFLLEILFYFFKKYFIHLGQPNDPPLRNNSIYSCTQATYLSGLITYKKIKVDCQMHTQRHGNAYEEISLLKGCAFVG